jgi:hypothetical protein
MADTQVDKVRSESFGPIHTEQVEQVRGMLRKTSGALVLTDEAVTFLPEQGSPLIVSLAELAWVEMARRSRDTVVELTLRTAVVYRFRVASNDWVQRIMRARAALVTPASPVALAS